MIVTTSVLIGTMLPFGLAKAGVDPANAGTSVQVCRTGSRTKIAVHCPRISCMSISEAYGMQVLMDISGVAITCFTCNLMLNHLSQVLLLG